MLPVRYAVLVVGAIVGLMVLSARHQATPVAAAAPSAARTQVVGTNWMYIDNTDRATGKVYPMAEIVSSNSLDLRAPYAGPNQGRLTLRRHPRFGLGALFSIEKGQIVCSAGSGCRVTVRVDGGPSIEMAASLPEDYSSNMLFLADAKRFLRFVKGAREVQLEFVVFEHGRQTLVFESDDGLEWK